MKKIGILMMMLFVLFGCSTQRENKESGKLEEINAKEALTMIEEKQDFVLVIGTTTCESCISFEETLEEYIAEKPITIYHLYIDNEPVNENEAGEVERTDFLKLCQTLVEVKATPTVVWVKDGKMKQSMNGMIDIKDFDAWTKKLEMIA